jgi:hypothetical protein
LYSFLAMKKTWEEKELLFQNQYFGSSFVLCGSWTGNKISIRIRIQAPPKQTTSINRKKFLDAFVLGERVALSRHTTRSFVNFCKEKYLQLDLDPHSDCRPGFRTKF